MKITVDTNVLVSASFWTGNSFRILDLVDKGYVELFLSEKIIEEYAEVIKRSEIEDKILDKDLILNKVVQKVIANSTIIIPSRKLDVVKEDFDDNILLECAVEARVDYIITQDNHLLKLVEFEGIKIITPEEFFNLFKDISESN